MIIRHVGIVVKDLESALEFWCETMGFQVFRKMDESGTHIDNMMCLNDVKVTTVKLGDVNGNLIELLNFTSHPDVKSWEGKPHSTGLTHIALTVSDIEGLYCSLRNNVLDFFAPPQESPDGLVKVTYARGPEGIILELVEEL